MSSTIVSVPRSQASTITTRAKTEALKKADTERMAKFSGTVEQTSGGQPISTTYYYKGQEVAKTTSEGGSYSGVSNGNYNLTLASGERVSITPQQVQTVYPQKNISTITPQQEQSSYQKVNQEYLGGDITKNQVNKIRRIFDALSDVRFYRGTLGSAGVKTAKVVGTTVKEVSQVPFYYETIGASAKRTTDLLERGGELSSKGWKAYYEKVEQKQKEIKEKYPFIPIQTLTTPVKDISKEIILKVTKEAPEILAFTGSAGGYGAVKGLSLGQEYTEAEYKKDKERMKEIEIESTKLGLTLTAAGGYMLNKYLTQPIITKIKIPSPKVNPRVGSRYGSLGLDEGKISVKDLYGRTKMYELTKYPKTTYRFSTGGSRTEVTTNEAKLLGFKPKYSGIPYGKGIKDYSKTLKYLLKKGYSEKEARTILRYTQPTITKIEIKGKNILEQGGISKAISETNIKTSKEIKDLGMGIKTRGGSIFKQKIKEVKNPLKETEDVSIIKRNIYDIGYKLSPNNQKIVGIKVPKISIGISKSKVIESGVMPKGKYSLTGKEYYKIGSVSVDKQLFPKNKFVNINVGKTRIVKYKQNLFDVDLQKETGLRIKKIQIQPKIKSIDKMNSKEIRNLVRDVQDVYKTPVSSSPKYLQTQQRTINLLKTPEIPKINIKFEPSISKPLSITKGATSSLLSKGLASLVNTKVKASSISIEKSKEIEKEALKEVKKTAQNLRQETKLKQELKEKSNLKSKERSKLKQGLKEKSNLKYEERSRLKQEQKLIQETKLIFPTIPTIPKGLKTRNPLIQHPKKIILKFPDFKLKFGDKKPKVKRFKVKSSKRLTYSPSYAALELGRKERISDKELLRMAKFPSPIIRNIPIMK